MASSESVPSEPRESNRGAEREPKVRPVDDATYEVSSDDQQPAKRPETMREFEVPEEPTPVRTAPQISLASMFLLMCLSAGAYLIIRSFPRDIAAGLIGGIAVFGLLISTFFKSNSPLVVVVWWLIMAFYLVVSILAAIGL